LDQTSNKLWMKLPEKQHTLFSTCQIICQTKYCWTVL